jgi:hypothetical protein
METYHPSRSAIWSLKKFEPYTEGELAKCVFLKWLIIFLNDLKIRKGS